MFLGWFIGEFFHLTIWELIKRKYNLDFSKLKTIFIFISIAILLSVIFSGLYRVQTNHAVIVTKITGAKKVITTTGIKYSLFSERKDITLQNQMMKFPQNFNAGYEIITKDKKPLMVASFLEYRIVDPYKWSILNKKTEIKLNVLLSSYTIQEIQNNNYTTIKTNISSISKEIENKLKNLEEVYGFKIVNLDVRVLDTVSVQDAKSSAEAEKIKAEALKKSYLSEAEALKIKYNTINNTQFLEYMELVKAIEEGKINNVVLGNVLKTLNLNQ